MTTAPRVVVIDDSADVRALVAAVLECSGFDVVAEVATAEAGEIAVGVLRPDVIVCDQHLGADLGTDLVANLRPQTDAVIVVLTAHADTMVRAAARRGGADAVVDKAHTIRLPGIIAELAERARATVPAT